MCGEHGTARVRVCPVGGIIPACAGNICVNPVVAKYCWDHPRVCGEHLIRQVAYLSSSGSSPRVRGTSVVSWRMQGAYWDHPRVCGEHGIVCGKYSTMPGSSPRVRGTSTFNRGIPVILGIIPACAGNMPFMKRGILRARDHPRVCGEHRSAVALSASEPGSSPRVRGTCL